MPAAYLLILFLSSQLDRAGVAVGAATTDVANTLASLVTADNGRQIEILIDALIASGPGGWALTALAITVVLLAGATCTLAFVLLIKLLRRE